MRFTGRIDGADRVAAELSRLGEVGAKAVADEVRRTAHLIERDAKREAPVGVSGDLRRRINTEFSDGGLVAEVHAGLPGGVGYAAAVELGTKPHFPPVAPLALWAKRVLGDERLGFVIARAIAERGTRAQPFLVPAYWTHIRDFAARLRSAMDRVIGRR